MVLPLFVFPFHLVGSGRDIPKMLRAEKRLSFLFHRKSEMHLPDFRPIFAAAGLPQIGRELLTFGGGLVCRARRLLS